MHKAATAVVTVLLLPSTAAAATTRSLDGGGNNVRHPAWGQAGTQYLRVAPPNYADGVSAMVSGPPARRISNRIFNDVGQNLFSERGLSQWAWAWGQFMDHDFGLRNGAPVENAPIPFDAQDPLEDFGDDLGVIDFARTPAASGTGVRSPRQQINTQSSYIDASNVYGVGLTRLDWLRDGARLLLPGDYLPRADARGDASNAPAMDLFGAQVGDPGRAAVAGDVRANENIALTAVQTLFAREHNRIVSALKASPSLTAEDRFQIARRVVGAELQFITYEEFLPNLGVTLAPYRGYQPGVNAGLGDEFATAGYRAHSMIHGEFEPTVPAGAYTATQLDTVFPAEGITVEHNAGSTVTLVIPLVIAFGNPDLLTQIGEGPILQSLGEHQYKNDEQIDNSLRSVLFAVPKPDGTSPANCGSPVIDPACFTDIEDLGADDLQRGRDHGMPSYNNLRRAYGLAPVRSFTQITGEATDQFPSDPKIDPRDSIDDPDILNFVQLRGIQGNVIALGSDAAQEDAVTGVRETTLAARLRAIYGDVNKVDAFVGMVSEKHVAGTEFGPLQLAIWKKQFQALRDGDRFFYLNDPVLQSIRQTYGISYQHTLAELLKLDAGITTQANVFKAE